MRKNKKIFKKIKNGGSLDQKLLGIFLFITLVLGFFLLSSSVLGGSFQEVDNPSFSVKPTSKEVVFVPGQDKIVPFEVNLENTDRMEMYIKVERDVGSIYKHVDIYERKLKFKELKKDMTENENKVRILLDFPRDYEVIGEESVNIFFSDGDNGMIIPLTVVDKSGDGTFSKSYHLLSSKSESFWDKRLLSWVNPIPWMGNSLSGGELTIIILMISVLVIVYSFFRSITAKKKYLEI